MKQGEIKVFGQSLLYGKLPPDIGIMIENPGFLPSYSGLMNLKFLAGIRKKITVDDVREYMKRVGLDPESKKHVSKYSLGMRQRLAILKH